MRKKLKLSVLDQTPIRKGGTAAEALKESAELIKVADQLGYTRYWFSEHHNTGSLAGSAPEILIANMASHSRHIRVGSGGVMLPNHSTLKVAENFRLLEALFPGRIDLGIGRAPGGDRLTARLLNPSNTFDERDYLQQLSDLQDFLRNEVVPGSIQEKVKAAPFTETSPELWILTSSGESASIAAHFGMAVSFAHFINPAGGPEAIWAYKNHFKASSQLQQPKASVGIFAICADTEEKANELKALMDYQLLNSTKGIHEGIPSYEEIKNIQYADMEKERIYMNSYRMISGTPEKVKDDMEYLAEAYDVDEVIISTITYDFADRLHSYELLAEAFELPKA